MGVPRRILHVVHGYYPESGGGTEAYVRSLLAVQPAIGLEPALLFGSFEPRPEPCLEPQDGPGVRAWRLHRADTYSDFWDKAHYPPAGQLFRDVLADFEPDLVHVHQWIRLTDDLVEIAESAGIPTLVSLHDLYSSCPACFRLRPDDTHCERELSFVSCADCVPLRGGEAREEVEHGIALYRATFRHELLRARRVLAATHATAELVTRGLGLDPGLVQLLPLGYERRFTAHGARPAAARKPLRLAYWGNVTQRKGVDVLLAALHELAARRPLERELELHVFGRIDTLELEADLKTRARGLPVVFHGRYEYDEIAELGVDLAVFPSTCFETYGFVLDEAFELGVPALVTDVGAFRERVGPAGFLVPPGDPGAIASTLNEILDSPCRIATAASKIPPLSPGPTEHAHLLLEQYARATATPARFGEPVDPALRARVAELRRHGQRSRAPHRRGL